MTLRDKLEIAVLIVTLLGSLRGLIWIASWLKRRREEREEDRIVGNLRLVRDEHPGTPTLTAKPMSAAYNLYERMVRKGKLAREPFGGYALPEDVPSA